MSTFLETNHLFLRAPDGGVFDVQDMKAHGFGAIFCNVRDYPLESWDTVRQRAAEAGIPCGPWARTADAQNEFDPSLLLRTVETADAWGDQPFIVNSESELKGSGADLTQYIANMCRGQDYAVSMECWPFANVDWTPLADVPLLPQIFPQEAEAAKDPQGCKNEWHAYGIECVVFTFGSYHEIDPDTFDRLTPYGVYTADDCGGDFARWEARGTHNPCKEAAPVTTQIGSQDGIKASLNKLRDLDPSGTLLVKGEGGWPDISTLPPDVNAWKAWDKLQRTLQILKDDHDA